MSFACRRPCRLFLEQLSREQVANHVEVFFNIRAFDWLNKFLKKRRTAEDERTALRNYSLLVIIISVL